MNDYPVQVEVTSPEHFDRIQLLLRLLCAIVLGWFGITAGWLACVLYGLLPMIAAIAVSTDGRGSYVRELAPQVSRVLAWLLQFSAYMGLLVDRFPTMDDPSVRIDIRITGSPTVGSALSRLVTSIPSALVLSVLWLVSGVLWIVAAVIVLFGGSMPASILSFQRGVLRWNARLVAYHASLVDEYPPFSFETDDHHGTTTGHVACTEPSP